VTVPEVEQLASPDPVTTNWVPIWNMGSGNVPTWSYGTTPPASPADGDLWFLPADATNGVIWMFRYRAASASAYKWEFVGGSALKSIVDADEVTSSAVYADLTPQSFTFIRAGEYDFHWGAITYCSTAATSLGMGLTKAGAAQMDQVITVPMANQGLAMSRMRNLSLAAGDVIRIQYKSSAASGHFASRYCYVTPVRVS
jgi:hypothetical protein